MTDSHPDQPHDVAISQLESLGLSSYAARTHVALASLGAGSAQDVSHVSEVPRTKVYEAAEELEAWGLIDVQHATPRQFWPVSTETATRLFHREYDQRIDELTNALDALEPAARTSRQRGVWTVTGRDTVTSRIVEWFDDATEEIVFMTVGELVDDDVLESLQAASDRDVSIKLGGMEPRVEQRLVEAAPSAKTFDSMWEWTDTPAGRLLMVDQRRTLASVLVANGEPEAGADETAIWGSGETNSLVTLLKVLFTWQLDGAR